SSYLGTQQVVGTITDADDRWLTIDVKNKFAPGDQLELITPAGNLRFSTNTMENRHGETMDYAPGSGHIVKIPKPDNLPEKLDFTYLTKIFPDSPAS
ncbi:MAG: U32 family peptidase C-terminal domain-containing protein, partial [Marinobacter sp.]|uniref:U32 family peptidase C-terminal domain-containing protein n=1 Tax=Marinobacter sp. TaxID=50741 RepID=UPI0029C54C97